MKVNLVLRASDVSASDLLAGSIPLWFTGKNPVLIHFSLARFNFRAFGVVRLILVYRVCTMLVLHPSR